MIFEPIGTATWLIFRQLFRFVRSSVRWVRHCHQRFFSETSRKLYKHQINLFLYLDFSNTTNSVHMQFATANRNVIGCRLSSVMSTWLTSNKICKRKQGMPVGCQTGTNLPSAAVTCRKSEQLLSTCISANQLSLI